MPETLEFSIMADDPSRIQPLLDQFEAEQGIHVRLHLLTFDTGWSDLVKFGLYNDGPDISEIGCAWVGDLVALNALHPFSTAEIKFLGGASAFVPSAWQGGILAGGSQVWGIPWNTGARLLFYRRSVLARAGVDERTAFQTSSSLDQALSRLQASEVRFPWAVPTVMTHGTLLNVASWVWEAGGDFVTPDGQRTLFNQPAARAGLRAYFALGRYLAPEARHLTSSGADELFLFNDETALTISGPWLFCTARAQEIPDLGGALPPGGTYTGGSYLVVWSHTRKKEAAMKLIHYLTRRPAQVSLNQAQGQLPARLDALESPPFATEPLWQITVAGLKTGRSFPVIQSWGLVEERLTAELGELWVETLSSPGLDLDTAIANRLEPLAKQLDLVWSQRVFYSKKAGPAQPSPSMHEDFTAWVHDALNHLYDSPYLQTHPLAHALGGENIAPLSRSQHLRRILLETITALQPEAGVPVHSSDWRAYRILELRYIESLSPTEVMNRLALAKSQYFREQARVLEAVTAVLWDKWQAARQESSTGAEAGQTVQEKLAHLEVERLYTQATWEAVDAAQLLTDLRPVVEPLSKVKNVPLHFHSFSHLNGLQADRVMLRQAILNTITYALDIVSEGRLDVGSFAERRERGLRIAASAKSIAEVPRRQGVGLEISQALMKELGGALQLEVQSNHSWEARLAWPMAGLPVLLVIDDYQDFAELLRRYLAAYNWQVVGATDSAAAQQVIAETRPTVILLDVMMPKEDGWELLMAFKAQEATRDIPIIICSVLNEPDLALSLGAAAYLQKPVTQEALVDVLAPWNTFVREAP